MNVTVAGPGSVVIVDDDPDDLELARRCYARSGATRSLVVCAGAPAFLRHLDAVEQGDAEPIAVAVVDLRMPEMTGFELVERLRARPRFAEAPPVVVLTTSLQPADRERAALLGCVDYVVKPTHVREFVAFFERIEAGA
ncbi:MAG: response regulator [Myxococcales bacterium]|nr:response regulator [Myxococcales bacterium]